MISLPNGAPLEVVGPPDFLLWHPLCADSGSGYTCTFDVTAKDFEEINEGTDALVVAFVTSLGMDPIHIDGWRIERFLSPYYAFEERPEQRPFGVAVPSTGDWSDRFGLAWRVSVRFTDSSAPFRYGGLGPYPAIGHDETWPYRPSVDGSGDQEETVVVIADCWGVEDWSFLGEFISRDQVEMIDIAAQVENFVQARVRLISGRPIIIEDAVVELLTIFTIRLFSTHRKITEKMEFWPQRVTGSQAS
ncbi:hypothetical protein [Streptomyces olivaceoviridis]|uniref:hypothetical protein n=1 Tax=Streptomyces olivaceoviridis TaxID=1921 RepID=UPI0033266265